MNSKIRKVLVITGASRGIGEATVQQFVQQEYRVINLSRSNCPVTNVTNIKVDLANQNGLETVTRELLQEIRKPDQLVLVHNAGMISKDTVSDIQIDTLRKVLELNVVAPAQLNTLLLPLMAEGSSIIYISSTLGTKAVANTYAYSISKHAVIGQMRATCQDLAGTKIHTAAVCPGFTETEMLRDHIGTNPEIYQQIAAGIAHKRLVQPSEIADAIWFCSQNPVVNGSMLHANLGQIEH
ncbi:MAG: SDR family oxidoreductase [Acidiferrobacterales bacterium]|nr:SDR family oxidoreductase [Acidiferrobacterales bacterium]